MDRRRTRALLWCCALGLAGRANAELARLDAFGALLRAREFAQLEDRLGQVARENPRDEKGEALFEQIVDRLGSMLVSDETLTPLLARWAEAAPRSRFEPLVRAQVEEHLAWRERGGGWADRVPESAWPRWYAHLESADAALAEAAKRAPDLAAAPAERVTVALLRGRPPAEMRGHFEAALRIDATNERAHRNLLYALTPRWGGANEVMLAFARDAAGRHPEDARLGLLVHSAHLEIAGHLPDADARLYYRNPAVWDEVSRALERLIAAYPGSEWAHNSLAYVAGRAGRKQEALHEFRWIGRRWDPDVWELSEFDRVRAWVLSTEGPAASRIERRQQR